MTPRLALDNYYVAVTSLIAAVLIMLYCISLYRQAKKTALLDYFLLTMSMVFVWLISKLLKTASPNIEIRWFFIITQYLGICLLNYYFLQFSWCFAYNRPMKRIYQGLSLAPMALSFLMIATNPLHMLFYSKYDLYRDSFGPLFYPHQFLSYIYLIYGVYLCTKEYKNSFYLKHLQSRIFAIGIFIPILINLMYVAKVLRKAFGIRLPMDITPLTVMLSLCLFSYAIKRYRFLDITPYAYEMALQDADKAIGVFDLQGNLKDANKKFEGLFAPQISSNTFPTTPYEIAEIAENQSFKHNVSSLKNRYNRTIGHVHEWVDQSQIQESIKKLESNNATIQGINEQLIIQGERLREMKRFETANRVSRDLHDVLGNTLVLTKTTLELINGSVLEKDTQNLLLLQKAKELMSTGIEEISKVIHSSGMYSQLQNEDLATRLKQLATQFEGTPVHLEINFCSPLKPSIEDKSNEIYAIIRESVTNAIRHGNAQDIYILYIENEDIAEFHIIDNGLGSEKIQMGMGLKGMSERAALIGGSLSYQNISEGGFKVTIQLIL